MTTISRQDALFYLQFVIDASRRLAFALTAAHMEAIRDGHERGASPCRWIRGNIVLPFCLVHEALDEQTPRICSDRLRWLEKRAEELEHLGFMLAPSHGLPREVAQ